MNFYANLFTGLSLFCGFVSIVFSLESHFTFASWAIIFSAVFDGLDGQVARINPIPSEFGKEYDSLVDVVSFGIAPAILGYIFIYHEFYLWASAALFIYLFCSILRLAKYNITSKDTMKNYFYGLPTTVSGGVLASFILIYRKKGEMCLPCFLPKILLTNFMPFIFFLLVLVLAFLMVSRIRYSNLDGLKQILGRKTKLIIIAVITILFIARLFEKLGVTIFTFLLIYLISPIFYGKKIKQ